MYHEKISTFNYRNCYETKFKYNYMLSFQLYANSLSDIAQGSIEAGGDGCGAGSAGRCPRQPA